MREKDEIQLNVYSFYQPLFLVEDKNRLVNGQLKVKVNLC